MKKKFIKTPLVGVQVHGAKDVGTRTVNLLMGEHAGEYVRGDIMDANAVIQAFDELKGDVDTDHDTLEELVNEIHTNTEGINNANTQIQKVDAESKARDEKETSARLSKDTELENSIAQEKTRAQNKEKEISDKLAIVDGDSNTEGSFRKAIADVIAAAPEDLDTLKEIADKLADNDDLHTALNQAITEKADASALANEVTRATGAENNLQAAIDTKQPKGNYLTQHQSLEGYAKKAELPTKISQLTNDSNFITTTDASQQYVTLDTIQHGFEELGQKLHTKQNIIVPGNVDISNLDLINDLDGLKNIIRKLIRVLKTSGLITTNVELPK